MNQLHLEGWGVRLRVSDIGSRSEFWCFDGRRDDEPQRMFTFRPRECPYDSIVIDGHSGYISFQALHWLSRNNIPVFIMNYDGTVVSSILPPMPIKADLRAAQFRTAGNPERKSAIAKAFVKAKIQRSLEVLDWLGERYDIQSEVQATKDEAGKLSEVSTVPEIRTVEGRTALRYWEAYHKALPKHLGFQGRMTTSRANNASDSVNLALNYGYGFLECECRMAVNAVGLELAVGFLHDFSDYQTKQSLVYDLQEPFRFLIDLTVMQAFESGKLDANSFFFTESDYRYRWDLQAKGRYLDMLREQFNAGILYKGRRMKWDTIIQEKANELGKYLTGRSSSLDFTEPAPILQRADSEALRQRILSLTQSDAEKLGIQKSTLHYLRKRAGEKKSFTIYSKVAEKFSCN
jgi:CRISPR-associated protein Cas1